MAEDFKDLGFEENFDDLGFEAEAPETVVAQTPKQDISKTESFIKGMESGASMGFADELAGAIGRGLEMLPGSSTRQDEELRKQGFTLPESSTYGSIRDEARKEYDAAQQANPLTSVAGNIVGGALTLPATGLAAIKGTTAAAKLGSATIQGAKAGALTGLGTSEAETAPELIEDIGAGALTGGVLGGATQGVIGGAQALGGALAEKMPTISRAYQKGKGGVRTYTKEFADETSKKVSGIVDDITGAIQNRKQELKKINDQNVAKIEAQIGDLTSDIKKDISATKKLQTGLNENQKVKFENEKGDLVKNIQQKFGETKNKIGTSYDAIETQIPQDKQFGVLESIQKLEDDFLTNGKSADDAVSLAQRFVGTQDPTKLSFTQLKDLRMKARELSDSADPALKRSYSNLLKNLNSQRYQTLLSDATTQDLAQDLAKLDKRYAAVLDLEDNYFGKVMFDQKTGQAFTDTLLRKNLPNKETMSTVNKLLQNKALSTAETEELVGKLDLLDPQLREAVEPKLMEFAAKGRQLEAFTPTVPTLEEATAQNPELQKLQQLLQQVKTGPEVKTQTDKLLKQDELAIRDYLKTALPELESPIAAEKGRSNLEQVLEDFKKISGKDLKAQAEEAVKDIGLVKEASEPLRGAVTPRSLGFLEGISQFPSNVAGRTAKGIEDTLYNYGSSTKNIFTDDIANVAANVRKIGTPEAEVYARQLDAAAQKGPESRNAVLFGLMQQPQFRQMFQGKKDEEK